MRTALALVIVCGGAHAQSVSLNGTMGDRALLVIDGAPRTLAVGQSRQGVKLLKLGDGEAQVQTGAGVQTLRIGGVPGHVGGSGGNSTGSTIVLSAGPGGHFVTVGQINGRSVQFLVDTGATAVSLGAAEAERIGLDYRSGQRATMSTANGVVTAYAVTLTSVRVGDVEVANVQAVVMPESMGAVLLGNSFLTRFQMKRENETLVLIKR